MSTFAGELPHWGCRKGLSFLCKAAAYPLIWMQDIPFEVSANSTRTSLKQRSPVRFYLIHCCFSSLWNQLWFSGWCAVLNNHTQSWCLMEALQDHAMFQIIGLSRRSSVGETCRKRFRDTLFPWLEWGAEQSHCLCNIAVSWCDGAAAIEERLASRPDHIMHSLQPPDSNLRTSILLQYKFEYQCQSLAWPLMFRSYFRQTPGCLHRIRIFEAQLLRQNSSSVRIHFPRWSPYTGSWITCLNSTANYFRSGPNISTRLTWEAPKITIRRGCSQSELQVTNFFLAVKNVVKVSVREKVMPSFSGGEFDRKFATKNPPRFSLATFQNFITLSFWDHSHVITNKVEIFGRMV